MTDADRRLRRLPSVLLPVAAVWAVSPAMAQEFEWTFNNGYAETRNEARYLEEYAEDIGQRSDGRLDVTVYHGGSLGLADADVLRWLPTGAVEMGFIWPNFLGRDAPALQAIYIQGSIGSLEEHLAALPVIEEIYLQEFRMPGIVPVGYMGLSLYDASVFCNGVEVDTLEELRGVKLRVWSRDQIETFARLGVTAQIVPQNDMYVALQTGVVDCALYPARLAHTVSLQEVTDSAAYLYPVAGMPYVIAVNEGAWDSLPEDLQQVVSEATDAMYARTQDFSRDAEEEQAARERLESDGVRWLGSFPEADRRAFLDAAAETWAEISEEAGEPAPTYRAQILDAIGR